MGVAVTLAMASGAQAATVKPMVSAGMGATNLVLKSDGSVLAWGENKSGQVGDGTTTFRNKPVKIALADVVSLSAGGAHSLALKADGTVWSWGSNTSNQLGHSSSSTPAQVSNLTDITAIAAGGFHSLALKKDGTVVGWGKLEFSIADGVMTSYAAQPGKVWGLSDIIGIAAGGDHAVALNRDGNVWTWGMNEKGQIGDGTTTKRSAPVKVAGLPKIVSIAAGYQHTLAVGEDGKVYAWGRNDFNQLGDGTKTSTDRSTPGVVKMLDSSIKAVDMSNIASVSAGMFSGVAISKSGIVYQWGLIPDSAATTTMTVGVDIDIMPIVKARTYQLSSRVAQVAAGSLYTLFLTSDGALYALGSNDDGALGTGDTKGADVPIQVSDENSGKLNLGALRISMVASGTPTGDKKKLSLTAKLTIDSEDAGKSGSYYVAAKVGNTFYLNNGKTWVPYTGGAYPVFASGVLADKDISVFADLDTSGLAGVTIIVAYGTSDNDMLNNKKFRTVHTIQ